MIVCRDRTSIAAIDYVTHEGDENGVQLDIAYMSTVMEVWANMGA